MSQRNSMVVSSGLPGSKIASGSDAKTADAWWPWSAIACPGEACAPDWAQQRRGRAATVTDLAAAINLPNVSAGEFLTVDIDQVGSTSPGSDLSVTMLYTID
jgi:hypothetical protein